MHRDAAAAYEQGQDMYDYYYSRGYYGSEDWPPQDERLAERKGKNYLVYQSVKKRFKLLCNPSDKFKTMIFYLNMIYCIKNIKFVMQIICKNL